MGYFKNLMVMQQENQLLGKEESSPKVFDETLSKKEEIISAFKGIRKILLSVKEMDIPQREFMLKNGNLSLLLSNKNSETIKENNLPYLLDQKEKGERHFRMLQQKRKLKSQDLPFIKSIYYNGFESDVWMEDTTQNFNENRANYPYLDMVLPKRPLQPVELYDFAVATLTRGYSEQRKKEKLAFQSAKASLKSVKEQIAILTGKQTQSTKHLVEKLTDKLNDFWLLRQISEENASATSSVFNAKQMFSAFVNKNMQNLNINVDQVWNIETEQDLLLAANSISQKEIVAAPKEKPVLQAINTNNQLANTQKTPVLQETQKQTSVQLAFSLDGNNVGSIIEKPSKKTINREK